MRRVQLLSCVLLLAACSDGAEEHLGDDGGPDSSVDAGTDAGGSADAADVSGRDGGSDADDAGGTDAREWPAHAAPACPLVTVTAVPDDLHLDPFYARWTDAGGIPIVGSDNVPDEAFAQAYYVIANMLRNRPCLRDAIVDSGIRIGIMARDEVTTDMPEYADFYEAFPGVDWDTRGRGFGATLVRPLTTGSVDNLLQDEDDPWFGENIMLHEFAHSFWEFGVVDVVGGRTHAARLTEVFADAIDAGLWEDTYAATNAAEYWAEGVQSWFDNNIEAIPGNGIHNFVNTRDELEEYDPELAALIAELFDPTPWPPYCATDGEGPLWRDPTPIASMPIECDFEARTLLDLGCDTIDATVSAPGETNAELVFVNRTYEHTYAFGWIDFDGQLVPYGAVGPRALVYQNTFVDHPWVVTDEGGDCVGVYRSGTVRGRVFLDPR